MCVAAGGAAPAASPSGSAANPVWVIKIGGRLVEDVQVRAQFAVACAGLRCGRVIVHGGGCVVTDLQAALGLQAAFEQGRRVTRPQDIDAVEMALSGAVNKRLVRALQRAGCTAVGVCGCDAAMIQCRRVPALGEVGMPERVDAALLALLINSGSVPVVSPVSLGPAGEPLNVNADDAACALAKALRAERLLLISDVTAVRVAGVDRAEIGVAAIEALIAAGEVTGGMAPKLRAAGDAVRAGVGSVWIGGFAPGATLGAPGGTVIC